MFKSVTTSHYLFKDLKLQYQPICDDFKNFLIKEKKESLQEQNSKEKKQEQKNSEINDNKKNSEASKILKGKPIEYPRFLLFTLVLYIEIFEDPTFDSNLLVIQQKLEKVENLIGFEDFNKTPKHNGFYKASITAFKRYVAKETRITNNDNLKYPQVNKLLNTLKEEQLGYTEIITSIKRRVGQEKFKHKLQTIQTKCFLCGVSSQHTIASHIKPWSVSNDTERLDVNNGLLLCPNHDYLFDRGFITFTVEGHIMISQSLTPEQLIFFNIQPTMRFNLKEQQSYLAYHREFIFKD